MKLIVQALVIFAVLTTGLAGSSQRQAVKILQNRLHKEPFITASNKLSDEFIETKWITQRLNHFDRQDNRTWSMRYMENSQFLEDGGPIFIFIGGEWAISTSFLTAGHMFDMSRDLNGIMFFTEHRYYGTSRPTPDVSTENLRFLSIDQALADLAHFIVHVKETNLAVRDSGVIIVGGSYGATLATFFMQKYPHLANGAWASSAPLEAKVDFLEFKEVVSESVELVGGSNCTGRIQRAFAEFERLVAENDSTTITETFRLCDPLDLTNQKDIWTFFWGIAESVAMVVQYHRSVTQDIQNFCDKLVTDERESDIHALASWWWSSIGIDIDNFPEGVCLDVQYYSNIGAFNGTSWFDVGALLSYRFFSVNFFNLASY